MCVQNRPQALSVIWSFNKQNPAALFVMLLPCIASSTVLQEIEHRGWKWQTCLWLGSKTCPFVFPSDSAMLAVICKTGE